MLKSIVRIVGLTCLASVVGLATEAQGAATISLKAVAKNGTPITPTNSLTNVARGDTITAEVRISGWTTPAFDPPTNTGLINTYQVSLLGEQSVISNGGDINNNAQLILPVGWAAPVVKDTCPCDNPSFPNCDPFYGCVAAGHAPTAMVSVCRGGTRNGLSCAVNADCTGGGTCPLINTTTRTDYIFYAFPAISSVDYSKLDIRWGGVIQDATGQTSSRCAGGANVGSTCTIAADCPGSTCDVNFQSYGGTLNLKVGAEACGTYTFSIANDVTRTFISNPQIPPVPILPGTIQGLTIQITGQTCASTDGACCDTTNPSSPVCSVIPQSQCSGATKRFGGVGSTCANINPRCAAPANVVTGVVPANCTVDARVPFPPNQAAQRKGFISQKWTFQNPLTTGEDAPNDFTVSQVPATTPPVPPTIGSVTPGPANNEITLNFRNAGNTADFPIQPNKWTCITHNASNTKRCLGFLPADAGSDLFAGPADILTIVDNLNGVRNPPLQIQQCDIDRSGVCLPADIIAEIDLLNGVNGYPVQNGKTLEACPSGP